MKRKNKYVLTISAIFVTFAMTTGSGNLVHNFIGVVLAIFFWSYFFLKKERAGYIDHIESGKGERIFSIICTLTWEDVIIQYFISFYSALLQNNGLMKINAIQVNRFVYYILILMCFPAGNFFFELAISKLILYGKKFYGELEFIEKRFIIVFCIFLWSIILITYTVTTAFYGARYNTVFTMDSVGHYTTNVFMNTGAPENDIRNPLFGLFALPVSILAMLASRIFAFQDSYAVFLQCFQSVLVAVTCILFARLLKLTKRQKISFYLIYSSSYAVLLFSVVLEQYIILVFWLALAIYCNINSREEKEVCMVGAIGTLPTNAIAALSDQQIGRSLKDWILYCFRLVIKVFTVMVCVGQTGVLLNCINSFSWLSKYTVLSDSAKAVSLKERLCQYLNFIRTCFWSPAMDIDDKKEGFMAVHLASVNSVSIVGLTIVILCVVSFVINRKNAYAKMCGIWCVFSFVLLACLGWCSSTNDMELYIYYFGWAIISLFFLLLISVIKNEQILLTISAFIMMFSVIYNINGIIKIVEMGILHYPVIN